MCWTWMWNTKYEEKKLFTDVFWQWCVRLACHWTSPKRKQATKDTRKSALCGVTKDTDASQSTYLSQGFGPVSEARCSLSCLPVRSYLFMQTWQNLYLQPLVFCVMDGPFYFTDSDQTRNPYRLGPREFTQTITRARLLHVSVIFQAKSWVFQRSQDGSKSADEALISNKLQPSSLFGHYQRKWPILLHCLWNITTKNKILSKSFPKEKESLFTLWVESLEKQINPH